MENKKTVDVAKIVPTLNKMLKNGKTVQMEYNHQNGEIKILEANLKRIKLD